MVEAVGAELPAASVRLRKGPGHLETPNSSLALNFVAQDTLHRGPFLPRPAQPVRLCMNCHLHHGELISNYD